MQSNGFIIFCLVLAGFFIFDQIGADKFSTVSTAVGKSTLMSNSVSIGGKRDIFADRAAGTAEDYVKHYNALDRAVGPIMAHDGSKAVFLGDVFEKWHQTRADEVVGLVKLVAPVTDCKLSPPARGSRVVNIAVDEPVLRLGIYAYGRHDLIAASSIYIDRLQNTLNENVPDPELPFSFIMTDVAVTETSVPVHLVFQSVKSEWPVALHALNTLVNLHLVDGARISGVTLLGGDAMGVSNLPSDVPIEAMTRSQMLDCGLENRSIRRLRSQIDKATRDKMTIDDAEVAGLYAKADIKSRKFNRWYEEIFGQRSDDTRIGYNLGFGTLVGPLPDGTTVTRLPYQPLAGAELRVVATEFIKLRGLHAWPDTFDAEVIDLTTKIAGGDINLVRAQNMMTRETN